MHYYTFFKNVSEQTHLLVAGTTGSGKSTFIKGILNALLIKPPNELRLVLIDPKKVELEPFRRLPHVIKYADTHADAIEALKYCCWLQEKTYEDMKRRHLQETDQAHIYIIIDELADLILSAGGEALPLLQKIAQLGRAAGIHLIAATQSPSRKTLPAEIMVNMTAQVALRCRSAIESRQILGISGAEELPKHGKVIYYSPDNMESIVVTLPPPEKYIGFLNEQLKYWLNE